MPQLDGLRGWACISVLVSHFFPAADHPLSAWLLPGVAGVRLFLVLSGFLMTGILLRARDAGLGSGRLLRAFYARRFLRIVPVFYAVLLVLYVVDYGRMRETIGWHLTFSMNIWRAVEGVHFFNHVWTLGVLAQFYLVWPLLILWMPRRLLAPVMLLVAGAAQVYRLGAWELGADFRHLHIMTIANLDPLALGGLLALFTHGGAHTDRAREWLERGGLAAGALGMALLYALHGLGLHDVAQRTVWANLPLGLLFCGIVGPASRGTVPGARWLLRPFTYLGRISYGVYVLHPVVWMLLEWGESRGLPLPATLWLRVPLWFGAAIAVAALSWHCFEQPLNRLKGYFPYRNARAPGVNG